MKTNKLLIIKWSAPVLLALLAAGCSSGNTPDSPDYYPDYFGADPATGMPMVYPDAGTPPQQPVGTSEYPEAEKNHRSLTP